MLYRGNSMWSCYKESGLYTEKYSHRISWYYYGNYNKSGWTILIVVQQSTQGVLLKWQDIHYGLVAGERKIRAQYSE